MERGPDDERDSSGLTSGDPLWSGPSESAPGRAESDPGGPEALERSRPGYGAGPVPPGAGGAGAPRVAPGPAGRPALAEWWQRAVALLVDLVVVSVGAVVIIVVIASVFGGIGFIGGDETGIGGALLGVLFATLVVAVVALLYAPLYMVSTNGQTLGKQALGIRVVRTDGQRVEFGWAVVREVLVKQLLFLVVGWSIAFGIPWLVDNLWPLWDDEHRALHDMMVNSRVVRA